MRKKAVRVIRQNVIADRAVRFALDQDDDAVIKIGGKFYSVEPGVLWCVVASGMEFERVPFE